MRNALETVLVAYGELALKSNYVRRRLERILSSQIATALTKNGVKHSRVLRRFGRIYVEDAPSEAADVAANVFGVVSAMPALRVSPDFESVIILLVTVASERLGEGESFAVRPKVVGDHAYSSRDLAVKGGSAVLEALSSRNIRVDLENPDVTLNIEVRDRDAFVYTSIIQGVGGMPYGSQGRLVSLFSGGLDSPVATWLMMKRGADVLPLFMDQRPYVGESYIDRVERVFKALSKYVPREEHALYAAPMGGIMGRIMEARPPNLICVLCKRSMYRIAQGLAREKRALGIVTGESLGQVASQTLSNMTVIDESVDLPVLRPLVGLDKVEIERIARRIGTYKVSARTVEGCKCVPDKPATRSRLEQVKRIEDELGLIELCDDAVRKIEKK